ncbi:hypothetical protein LCGC14_1451470 [marine sediment metagenome]|uniref:Uncharacterized protein n=1 Tax=marine sediment metagenome TaxID=412755 RepID=A0A0F9MJJ3_9ZZZZ
MFQISYEVIDDLITVVNVFQMISSGKQSPRGKTQIMNKIDPNMSSFKSPLTWQRYENVLEFLEQEDIIVHIEVEGDTLTRGDWYWFTNKGLELSGKSHSSMSKQFEVIIDSFNSRQKVIVKSILSRYEFLDIEEESECQI